MKQEDKELLLKDISARLPYRICVEHTSGFRGILHDITVYFTYNEDNTIKDYLCYTNFFKDESCKIEFFKPYLFPLSSMTEEQYDEMEKIVSEDYLENIQVTKEIREKVYFITHWPLYSPKVIDWFNKNHFDYRDLIPKELAIDATGLNIY